MAVQKIDDLVVSVTALHGTVDSAIALINGFSARLQAAIAEALANGATETELEPLVTLRVDVDAKKQALADAVAANT